MRLRHTQGSRPLATGAACVLLLFACSDGEAPPAGPAAIEVVAGDEQRAPAGTELPLPVRVRVVDGEGQGVPGIRVDFAVLAGGGEVDPASQPTDLRGGAEVSWTLGEEPGVQRLQATAAGLTLPPVTITATGVVGEGARLEPGVVGEAR